MKSKSKLIGVLAAFCGALAIAAQCLFGGKSLYTAANTATTYYNYAVDTHKNSLSRTNDAAITTRHLLYKEGTTAGVTVAVAGANDRPLGTIDNTETATGKDQQVLLLGKKWTKKMIVSAAMAIGDDAYTAAGGKIQGTPTTAGVYWRVGRLLTPGGADGDIVEVDSCVPEKVVAIALLGNVNGAIAALTFSSTPTQAEANALRAACETLADDVRALAAALTTSTKIIELSA